MPTVSIIVTTYNRAHLIGQTIESVLAQTFRDWEMVIVDDASTDDTERAVNAFFPDKRITYVRQQENQGAQVARNLGLSATTGEFVNFLDSDDLFAPQKLERQVEVLRGDPKFDLAACQTANFHENPGDMDTLWNTFAGGDLLLRFLSHDPVFGIHAPLWRRAAIERIGPFDESLQVCQDYSYHTSALCLGISAQLEPVLLAYARTHTGSGFRETKAVLRFETLHRLFLKFHALLEQVGELTEERNEAIAKSCLWASMYLARLGPFGSWRGPLRSFLQLSHNPHKNGIGARGEALSAVLSLLKRDRPFRMLRKQYESVVGSFGQRDCWSERHRLAEEPVLAMFASGDQGH